MSPPKAADNSAVGMSEKNVLYVEEPSQTSQEKYPSDAQVDKKLVPKLHLKLPKVNIVLTRCDKEKSPEKISSKEM